MSLLSNDKCYYNDLSSKQLNPLALSGECHFSRFSTREIPRARFVCAIAIVNGSPRNVGSEEQEKEENEQEEEKVHTKTHKRKIDDATV